MYLPATHDGESERRLEAGANGGCTARGVHLGRQVVKPHGLSGCPDLPRKVLAFLEGRIRRQLGELRNIDAAIKRAAVEAENLRGLVEEPGRSNPPAAEFRDGAQATAGHIAGVLGRVGDGGNLHQEAQRLYGSLALGDVGVSPQPSQGFTTLVAVRRPGSADDNLGAILSGIDKFTPPIALADQMFPHFLLRVGENRLENRADKLPLPMAIAADTFLDLFLRLGENRFENRVDAFPQDFLFSPPIEALSPLVPVTNSVVKAANQNRVAGHVEELCLLVYHFFRALARRNVFDREQDQVGAAVTLLHGAALKQQRLAADSGELLLHLQPREPFSVGMNTLQEMPQLGNIPNPVARAANGTPFRRLGRNLKEVVEGAIGRLHAEVDVEDQQ